jgi:flagellar hook-associated protein 2
VSTSSTSNIPFTGISQYAADFQAVLNKAVLVAQIPVTLLQHKDAAILAKASALGTINSDVAALADSLKTLGFISAGKGLGATSSAPDVVSVTSNGAQAATTYTINSITSIASAASERTANPTDDASSTPVSSTGTMQLIAGNFSKTFDLTTNTMVGLRDQINSLGAGVTATILTTAGGNYLSISANTTGAISLQLNDDPAGANTNILTSTNQGANAEFHLNGIDVTQSGNVVNSIIPGVTFSLLNTSTAPITLSLQSDPGQLSDALQDLVTKYNTVQTDLGGQVGHSGGALVGDSVIAQIQSSMRQITSYRSASGSVQSLADLGVSLSNTGVASFSQSKFNSLTSAQISDGFAFIGSSTTGLGGFSSNLTQLSDPLSGLIAMEQAGLKRTDQHMQDQMAALNTRIANMQAALTMQLETADAMQAQLQSQQNKITGSLQAASMVLYGKNETQF